MQADDYKNIKISIDNNSATDKDSQPFLSRASTDSNTKQSLAKPLTQKAGRGRDYNKSTLTAKGFMTTPAS